jgi:tetratricopeptide (TPR) repeat protein
MHSQIAAILFSSVTLLAVSADWEAEREQALRQHAAGNYREAERLFRSALAGLREMAPADPRVPEILNDLGADCHMLGRYTEAEQFYHDALSVWQAQKPMPVELVSRAWSNLATTYRTRASYREAEDAYREALQLLDGDTRSAAQFAFTLSNLADLYRTQDKLGEALPLARRAVAMLQEGGNSAAPRLIFALQTLAAIERAQGDLDEAGALFQKALVLSVAQNGEDHPATATVKNNLAEIGLKLGRYEEAEKLAREAVLTWRRALGAGHQRVGTAAANLAQALRLQQRYADAEPQFETALGILQGADRARCLANYADMRYQQGKPVEAVDFYRQALEAAQRSFGPEHPQTALIMTRLAEVRRSQGLYAESVRLYRRALPVLEAAGPSEQGDLRAARQQFDETLKESARTMLIK